jgi:hypothetical protein
MTDYRDRGEAEPYSTMDEYAKAKLAQLDQLEAMGFDPAMLQQERQAWQQHLGEEPA